MRFPVIRGIIRRRLLINFRVDVEVASRPLTPPFLMRFIVFDFLCLALFAHVGKSAEQDSPFDFSISAPRTWSMSELSVISDAVKRLDDQTLKAILRGAQPAVLLLRYPPSLYTGLNPSVKVLISETPDTTPAELLAISRDAMKKVMTDYNVEEKIHATKINGILAASMAGSFTMKYADGKSYPTLGRVWAIKRGRFIYVLGTSGPTNPSPELQKDFDFIISTFRFTR
jgi:hypothetical protein